MMRQGNTEMRACDHSVQSRGENSGKGHVFGERERRKFGRLIGKNRDS